MQQDFASYICTPETTAIQAPLVVSVVYTIYRPSVHCCTLLEIFLPYIQIWHKESKTWL
jgi:hypothetical protein